MIFIIQADNITIWDGRDAVLTPEIFVVHVLALARVQIMIGDVWISFAQGDLDRQRRLWVPRKNSIVAAVAIATSHAGISQASSPQLNTFLCIL